MSSTERERKKLHKQVDRPNERERDSAQDFDNKTTITTKKES